MILQCLHLLAHGSGGDMQLFGSRPEALVPRNNFKGTQRIQRWQASTHRKYPIDYLMINRRKHDSVIRNEGPIIPAEPTSSAGPAGNRVHQGKYM
jgi:hypothetical protein